MIAKIVNTYEGIGALGQAVEEEKVVVGRKEAKGLSGFGPGSLVQEPLHLVR